MDPRALSKRLKLASPCPIKWSEMQGDDRVRRCGACKFNVYSAAAMTTVEIEALLSPGTGVCMNVYRRFDGTLVTGDCSRVWAERRSVAASLAPELSMIGALVALIIIGLATVVLFGDDLRRYAGSSAGGVMLAPLPSPSPVMKKKTASVHSNTF